MCIRDRDWDKRIKSPYLLFDPELSRFDLIAPVHVSTYRFNCGVSDVWRGKRDAVVRRLEALLFNNRSRRLRTSHTGFGHTKLRLSGTDEELFNLRSELIKLFDSRGPANAPQGPVRIQSPAHPFAAPRLRLRAVRGIIARQLANDPGVVAYFSTSTIESFSPLQFFAGS